MLVKPAVNVYTLTSIENSAADKENRSIRVVPKGIKTTKSTWNAKLIAVRIKTTRDIFIGIILIQ